jgi:class 3 adenylate cyclase/streptogramin lyase
MAKRPARPRAGATERRLATVFFTDMVGSTELAARLGDRRWQGLLSEYHHKVRRALKNNGGREVDNAGDGFFAVFDQPAQAISCACELTDDLHTAGIEVRTGIHMGEVEPVGAKLGGIGVHIGARVAGTAKPGDVLVTSTIRDVVSGAGFEFYDAGLHALKGVPGEWRLHYVSWPGALPLDDAASRAWETTAYRRRGRALRRYWPLALVLGLGAIALGVVLDVLHPQTPAAIVPAANTVAQIDASAHAFRADVPVGNHPTGVAIGGGAVWVINASDKTLSRIDLASGQASPAKAVGGTPTAIAFGDDSVWVGSGSSGAVFRFDPTGNLVRQIDVPDGVAGMAFGANAVWIASPLDDTVIRIDPVTNKIASTIRVGKGPQAIAVGGSAVWVANALDHTLTRIDPATNIARGGIAVGSEPDALAADSGAVWVASTAANTVTRFDASSLQLIISIPVGIGPVDLAVGNDGTVWIAESTSEKVERIDARSNRIVGSLTVRGHPEAIDSQGGFLWAAVSAD